MNSGGIKLDHVILGVRDLDAAAAVLSDMHGLTAIPGGRHRSWGTANRLIPCGACYLELVTVVNPDDAATSSFGRWVLSMLDGGARMGWAVRTDDIRAVAARLDLEVTSGSRRSALGSWIRWQ